MNRKLNKAINDIRTEFKIDESVSDQNILDSLDSMSNKNLIELEIVINEFSKEARMANKKARHIHIAVSKSEMW